MKSESEFSFIHSFKYAFEGLRFAFVTQPNFRFHLVAAILVSILAFWLGITVTAWAVLVLTIGFVLVVEMINTALEVMVDLVSPAYHPLAKNVKDLAAGAVLLAAMVSIIVGFIILGPPLLKFILN